MIDIQELGQVITQGKYAFLIGNGINLANGGENWMKLLQGIVGELLGQESYLYNAIGKPGITNTEIQNIISLEYNRKKEVPIGMNTLMKIVIEKVRQINFSAVPMLDWIKKRKSEILTTNYDFNIEKYLWKEQYERCKSGNLSYITSGFYPWDNFYCNSTEKSENSLCRVWHIHGDIDHWQSIILSMTRYMGAVRKAMGMIHKSDPINNFEWAGIGTWLDIFFNKPLIIVGLALDPQELFLRWLLIERASRLRSTGNNMQKSYYLSRETDREADNYGKSQFMKFLGIEMVYFPDELIYKHDIWNV